MPEIITSTGNPRVKEALRLRGKRAREREARILIDGLREIARASDAKVAIDELFFCDTLIDGAEAANILNRAKASGVAITQVSEPVFDKLRYGDRTGGLLAVARRPEISLDQLRLSPTPLIAVVEALEKPGNLGAIVRTADAAGIDAILVVDPGTDLYGPNVIRASLGTIFCLPVVETSIDAAIQWLEEKGLALVAATPEATSIYSDLDLTKPVAFVFGSESSGLSAAWRKLNVIQASIPMRGKADSLNVATSAALFFYEALRQRSH